MNSFTRSRRAHEMFDKESSMYGIDFEAKAIVVNRLTAIAVVYKKSFSKLPQSSLSTPRLVSWTLGSEKGRVGVYRNKTMKYLT